MSTATATVDASRDTRRQRKQARGAGAARDKRRRSSGLRTRVELWLFLLVQGWFCRASIRSGYRVFELGALLLFYFVPRMRKRILRGLEIAYGDRPMAWRKRLLWENVRHTAWTLCDWLRSPSLVGRPDRLPLIDVREAVDTLRAAGAGGDGPGALIFSAHLGQGDLIATAIAHHLQPDCQMAAAVRPVDNLAIDQVLVDDRLRCGRLTFDKRGFLKAARRLVKQGGVACLMIDQDAGRSFGVFVPFFGRLASTTPGAAQLVRITGAPMIGMFAVRTRRRELGYRCHVVGPIDLPSSGDRDADLRDWTRRMTEVVEAKVRQFPEQYFWVHRRWKSRPPVGDQLIGVRED